jgi:hypothetical protein
MEYNSSSTKDIKDFIEEGLSNLGEFSFELINGDNSPAKINMPPVIEIIKSLNFEKTLETEQTERLTRYCLLNRIVIVKYNGEELGRFIFNDLDSSWENYQVLVDNPLALQFIINVCISEVIKKSIPPRIKKV